MKHFYVSLLAVLLLILLHACKESAKIEDRKQRIEDSLGIKYVDSEYVIDNEYTRIRNALCDKVEFSDLKFTNANTTIYALDPIDTTKRFLFVSEVECGYTSGNCGSSIDIVERKGDKHQSALKVCGIIDTVAADLSFFEYVTFTKRKFRVSLKSKKPQATLISIHGMPFSDLKAISKSTNIYEDNLILKGEKSENLDAVAVDFKHEALDGSLQMNVYKMDNFGIPFGFVFLHYDGQARRPQQIGGSGKLRVFNKNEELMIELADGTQSKKWKYNKQKKIFLPI